VKLFQKSGYDTPKHTSRTDRSLSAAYLGILRKEKISYHQDEFSVISFDAGE
jgi:hypothetical protein